METSHHHPRMANLKPGIFVEYQGTSVSWQWMWLAGVITCSTGKSKSYWGIHNTVLDPGYDVMRYGFISRWKFLQFTRVTNSPLPSIVPLILVFWDVNEKHFTYAGFDQFSIWILFYQLCWSYVFLFVVWGLLGKELTHICLCLWVIMS